MKTSADNLSSPSAASPLPAEAESLRAVQTSSGLLSRAWRWLGSCLTGRSSGRRLQVAETVSLGEKRFVAVVQVDGRHFLLAGGPTNIALLAQLKEDDDFEDVLKKTMTVSSKEAEIQPEKPARRARRAKKPATRSVKTEPSVQDKKKATKTVAKNQPKTHPRQSSRQAPQPERFGGIPASARSGAKAFEQWLEHAVPVGDVPPSPVSKVAQSRRQPSPAAPKPPGSSPTPPKQTLNEWLQEARNQPERPSVQVISESPAQSTVEEYA